MRTSHPVWGDAPRLTREDAKQIIVVPVSPESSPKPDQKTEQAPNASYMHKGLNIGHVLSLIALLGIFIATIVSIYFIVS